MNFRDIIIDIAQRHGIRIEWHEKESGRAYVEQKLVKIPFPRNVNRFLIGTHELGHCIREATYKKLGRAKAEYLAETFAIQTAKDCGIDKSHPTYFQQYCELARRYVIAAIARDHNRRKKPPLIDDSILEFCQFSRAELDKWAGHKVIVLGANPDDFLRKLKIFFDVLPKEERIKMEFPVSAIKSVKFQQ
jgi:hypothetical protein